MTGADEAPATGTPAVGGVASEQVLDVLRRVHERLEILGGDVVEVAPPLGARCDWADESTCRVGAAYLHELLSRPESAPPIA